MKRNSKNASVSRLIHRRNSCIGYRAQCSVLPQSSYNIYSSKRLGSCQYFHVEVQTLKFLITSKMLHHITMAGKKKKKNLLILLSADLLHVTIDSWAISRDTFKLDAIQTKALFLKQNLVVCIYFLCQWETQTFSVDYHKSTLNCPNA